MGFSTYADNIYSVVETHDNATAIEWWNELASREEKQQFIEYIQRPFANQNEFIGDSTLEEHISTNI